MDEDVTILSTKPLPVELIELAARKGIRIICEPFIITEAVDELEVQQEAEMVSLLETTVIFTSARAVEIVKDLITIQPAGWRIYCIGHNTRDAVGKYFGRELVEGTADDGNDLANKIIAGGIEEAFFFCGDKRMDTISSIMKEHGVLLTEIIVYRTIEVPHKISFSHAGVMCFSPSAVRSYFLKNKPRAGAVFFCIGNTTADEVRKFSGNKIIIAGSPTIEDVTKEVIEFYT